MTQAQFDKQFKLEYPHYEVMTLTDRRVYYNGLIETYRICDLITDKQAQSWGHPNFLTTKRNKIDCNAY